jgi:phosphatidylglycerophosphatase C
MTVTALDAADRRPRVVAFDVDETITVRDCVVPFLRRVAGGPDLALALARHPLAIAGGALRRDRDRLKAVASDAVFAGRHLDEVASAARRFAAETYEDNIRHDVAGLLRSHRLDGDTVVLISASYELYLRPLAGLLDVEHVLGTRLAVDADGRLSGALDGPNCRAGEKVRRLDRWLNAMGLRRDDVHLTAYGDSTGDRELLLDADVAHWMGRGTPPSWMPRP